MPPAATGFAVAEPDPLALIIRYIFPSAASENTDSRCTDDALDAYEKAVGADSENV